MVLRTVVGKSSNISLKLSLFNSGCCENTLIKLASRFSQKESTRKEDLSLCNIFFDSQVCCGRGLVIIQRTVNEFEVTLVGMVITGTAP